MTTENEKPIDVERLRVSGGKPADPRAPLAAGMVCLSGTTAAMGMVLVTSADCELRFSDQQSGIVYRWNHDESEWRKYGQEADWLIRRLAALEAEAQRIREQLGVK